MNLIKHWKEIYKNSSLEELKAEQVAISKISPNPKKNYKYIAIKELIDERTT